MRFWMMVALVVSLAVACGPAPTPPPTAPTASVAPPTPTALPVPTPTADPVAGLAAALRAAWWPDAQLHPRQDGTYRLTLPSQGEDPPRDVLLLPQGENTAVLAPTPTTGVEEGAPSPAEGGTGGEAEPAPGELVVWSREEGVQAGKVVVELAEGGAPLFYFVPWNGESWGQPEEITSDTARKLAEQGYIDPFAEALSEQGLELTPATLEQLPRELVQALLEITNPMSEDAYRLFGSYINREEEFDLTGGRELNAVSLSTEERLRVMNGLYYYVDNGGNLYVFTQTTRESLLNNSQNRQFLSTLVESLGNSEGEEGEREPLLITATSRFVFALPLTNQEEGRGIEGFRMADLRNRKGWFEVSEQNIRPVQRGDTVAFPSWLPSGMRVGDIAYLLQGPVLLAYEGGELAVGIKMLTSRGFATLLFPGTRVSSAGELIEWQWPVITLAEANVSVYVGPDGTVYPNPAVQRDSPLAEETLVLLGWPVSKPVSEPVSEGEGAQGNPAWAQTLAEMAFIAEYGKPPQDLEIKVVQVKNPMTGKVATTLIYFVPADASPEMKEAFKALVETSSVLANNEGFGLLFALTAGYMSGQTYGEGVVIATPSFKVDPNKAAAERYPSLPNILNSDGTLLPTIFVRYHPSQVRSLYRKGYLPALVVHEAAFFDTSAGVDKAYRTVLVAKGVEKGIIEKLGLGEGANSYAEYTQNFYLTHKDLKTSLPEDLQHVFLGFGNSLVSTLENKPWLAVSQKTETQESQNLDGKGQGDTGVREEEQKEAKASHPITDMVEHFVKDAPGMFGREIKGTKGTREIKGAGGDVPVGHVIWVNRVPFKVEEEPVRVERKAGDSGESGKSRKSRKSRKSGEPRELRERLKQRLRNHERDDRQRVKPPGWKGRFYDSRDKRGLISQYRRVA